MTYRVPKPHRILLLVLTWVLIGWNVPVSAATARMEPMARAGKPKSKPPVPKGPAGGCIATKGDNALVPPTISGEAGPTVETLREWFRGDLDSYRSWLGDVPVGFSAVCLVWPLQAKAPSGQGIYYSGQIQQVAGSTKEQCVITVNPTHLMSLDDRSRKYEMAEAAFRCYELKYLDSRPLRPWIYDGGATWAANTIVPKSEAGGKAWTGYFANLGRSLLDRGADGIGFFGELAWAGVNVWEILPEMLHLNDDIPAYDYAVNHEPGLRSWFLDSWAAGYLREKDYGKPWNLDAPSIAHSTAGAQPMHNITVAPRSTQSASIRPYTQEIDSLNASAEIVRAVPTGHIRIGDGSTDVIVQTATDFCMKRDGCNCPKGTTYDGPKPLPLKNDGSARVALDGTDTESTVSLVGFFLKDFCKPKSCSTGSPGALLSNHFTSLLGARFTQDRVLSHPLQDASFCDCPVGTWQLDPQSLADQVNWEYAHLGQSDTGHIDSVSGAETLDIRGDNTATLTMTNLVLNGTFTKHNGTMTIHGSITAPWISPEPDTIKFLYDDPGTDFTYQTPNGAGGIATFDHFPTYSPWSFGNTQSFSCSGTGLSLYFTDTTTTPQTFTAVNP